jgi:hypothetical protein
MLNRVIHGGVQFVPQRLYNVEMAVEQFNPFMARFDLDTTAAALDVDGNPYMSATAHVMRCSWWVLFHGVAFLSVPLSQWDQLLVDALLSLFPTTEPRDVLENKSHFSSFPLSPYSNASLVLRNGGGMIGTGPFSASKPHSATVS